MITHWHILVLLGTMVYMDTTRTHGIMLLAVAATFLFGILVGSHLPTRPATVFADPEFDGASVDLAPVWTAWQLLDEKFVPSTTTDPLSDEEKVWGMIEGLAAAYGDPYTTFMPPRSGCKRHHLSGFSRCIRRKRPLWCNRMRRPTFSPGLVQTAILWWWAPVPVWA